MESMFSSNRPGWAALLDEKVTAYLPDLKYIHDEPLARHTSFRIGGPATRMEELSAKRRASQPLEMPSAGSTFKRPEGYFAGTLIEQCGLKGKHVGGAEVSRKHAGFVVNAGGATCADVLALIKKVQDTVFTATGVTLEPEVKIIR